MIRRIRSDLVSFRAVEFQAGMNVVLADQAKDADETESTNGLGKTTLIRIIQFCLGSELNRDKVLNHPELLNTTFMMDFVVGGIDQTVARNTSTPNRVTISQSLVGGKAIEFERVDVGNITIKLEDWKRLLSEIYFPDTKIKGKDSDAFAPTFRDLALYFARIGKAAYGDPQLTFQGQAGASKKLCVSYLLGLNWSVQRKLQNELLDRANVRAAIKAMKTVEVTSRGRRSIGELEADRVALEAQLRAKRAEVIAFNVREDYRDLEAELGNVDGRIHDLINANYSDTRLRDFYKASAVEQPEADPNRPLQILKDAGAIFKEEALKKLDEVAKFHSEVYRNRKDFLQGEIKRLTDAIKQRGVEIDSLSARKTKLLNVLKSSGAIDTLIELQRSSNELNARQEALAAQIAEMKRFDRRDDEITATISKERSLLKSDLEDRREAVDEARSLFAEYTTELYGKPGRLSVDIATEGYSFTFTIERGGSDGVDQMVVFCFDLTFASLFAKRGDGFPTLIHDSSLFADVDPRQFAAAIRLAAERSKALGFQYICCLNSGSLPMAHFSDFKLSDYVRLTLTDDGPQGRLLGKKLPPIEKQRSS